VVLRDGDFLCLMKIEDIKIDPELRDLLCPLTDDEERSLEGSLLADGCISPLIIEERSGLLIDGHNRLRLCQKNSIPYEVKTLFIGSRDRIEEWIIQNQIGRRNLTPERMEIYIAKLYQSAKKKAGFQAGDEGGPGRGNKTGGQNDHAFKTAQTAKKVAERVGKSEKTVRRVDKKIEAVEKAGKLKEYGDGKLPKQEVKEIMEAAKLVRKQTKAEADEEAEVMAENPGIFKEEKPKQEAPDLSRVESMIEAVKGMEPKITKPEIKALIQFLKSL
jgi:hypothetical protein